MIVEDSLELHLTLMFPTVVAIESVRGLLVRPMGGRGAFSRDPVSDLLETVLYGL